MRFWIGLFLGIWLTATIGWAEVAPEFDFHTPPLWPEPIAWVTENGSVQTLSDYSGKVVLLNVWATWCTPCVREMPQLDKLQWRYGDAGFAVVAIAQDESQTGDGADVAGRLRVFYNKYGLKHLPVFHDPAKFIPSAFGPQTMPTSYLINRKGEVIATAGFGDWDSDDARRVIEAALRAD